MKFLDVGITCSPERYMPQLALDYLLVQKIPLRIFFSNAIGSGAADARNNIQDMWIGCKDKSEFFLMTDNDILIPEDSIQDMIEFLNQNEDFGAISLHRTELPEEVIEPSHINAGPVLFRSEVFEKIRYHNKDGCECQGQSNDVRNLGFRIGYLNGWQYDHIDRTKMRRKEENVPTEINEVEEMAQPEAIEIGEIDHD